MAASLLYCGLQTSSLDDPEGRKDAIFVRGESLSSDQIDIVSRYSMLGLTA